MTTPELHLLLLLTLYACPHRKDLQTVVIDDTPIIEAPRVLLVDETTGLPIWPPGNMECESLVRCCQDVARARGGSIPPEICISWALDIHSKGASCEDAERSVFEAMSKENLVPESCSEMEMQVGP